MNEFIAFGWSLGALSVIVFDSLYTSWTSYRRDLRLSRCNCGDGEE